MQQGPFYYHVSANITGTEVDGTPMTCTFTFYDVNGYVLATVTHTQYYSGEGLYDFTSQNYTDDCYTWSFVLHGRNPNNPIRDYYLYYSMDGIPGYNMGVTINAMWKRQYFEE